MVNVVGGGSCSNKRLKSEQTALHCIKATTPTAVAKLQTKQKRQLVKARVLAVLWFVGSLRVVVRLIKFVFFAFPSAAFGSSRAQRLAGRGEVWPASLMYDATLITSISI
jgi:hypothetical protein